MTSKPSRRFLNFSLRSLLVVTTLLGCFLAWQTHVVRQRRALRATFAVNSSFTFTSPKQHFLRLGGPTAPSAAPVTVPLVRRLMGDEPIQQVVYQRYYGDFTEADLARLKAAFPEAEFVESLPEPCHPGCFPAGTLVETPSGTRPIESLSVGDQVLIVTADGQLSAATVESIFTTPNFLWQVVTDDGALTTTETQPLCTSLDQTAQAGDLQPGDTLLRYQAGAIAPVRVVQVKRTGRSAVVYNLVIGHLEHFIAGGFIARSKPPQHSPPPIETATVCPPR